jgi:hypothetical protein
VALAVLGGFPPEGQPALRVRARRIYDSFDGATIIAAPPSTKNKARDPEMHQTK